MSSALIIGIASQDGSYLADLLLGKKYRLIGTVRKSPSDDLFNISHLKGKFTLRYGDLTEPVSFLDVIKKFRPDEIYNLAALSVPSDSWSRIELTTRVNGLGPAAVLEAVRRYSPRSRFFQASSREIFGSPDISSADESTPLSPQNPYAVSKAFAHFITKMYRENGLFAVNGILFNHESPRRPASFVTRKISLAVARIKSGSPSADILGPDGLLHLWDLKSTRDRGFAGDYVRAMWLMLQSPQPKDYVVATGRLYTVGDICRFAFGSVGLDWKKYVVEDGRPDDLPDTPGLKGDSHAIRRDLGWKPQMPFDRLISDMVQSDLRHVKV